MSPEKQKFLDTRVLDTPDDLKAELRKAGLKLFRESPGYLEIVYRSRAISASDNIRWEEALYRLGISDRV